MTDSDKAKSIKARLLNMADGDNKKYQQLVVKVYANTVRYEQIGIVFDRWLLISGKWPGGRIASRL